MSSPQRIVRVPQSLLHVGVARGDITPPVGIYHRMWGAATHDRSEGVHRPLTATAVYFQQLNGSRTAATQQVIVALDHCLLGRAEMDTLLAAVEAKTGVPRECLVVAFSHTHAAGLMSLDRTDLPGGELIPSYLERINETVSELVQAAASRAVPAAITYGSGRCDLAVHRDQWDQDTQQWVCGFDPQKPADDTVLVARITGDDGELIATLVNYACHPTTLAWDNRLISPDYPGAMRETIEDVTKVPCVFLQGASGELGPRHGYVGDVTIADGNGRQLGYAALAALAALPPAQSNFEYIRPVVSGATIGVWDYVPKTQADRERSALWRTARDVLPVRYRPGLPRVEEVEATRKQWLTEEQAAARAGDEPRRRDCRAMVERQTRMLTRLKFLPPGESFPYQLRVWRMGDAIWVAAQGEPYSALQTSLRQQFPTCPIVVCSLANGWGPSYLPPVELYGRGIYQESIAALAPGALECVIAEAACRIEHLLQD